MTQGRMDMPPSASSKITREILDDEGRMVELALARLRPILEGEASFPATAPETDRRNGTWESLQEVGPIPLAAVLDSLPLFFVAIPGLTLGKSVRWLADTYDWPLDLEGSEGSPHRLAGLLVLSHGPGGFLFCNADDPLTRQRFSIAHEIGHFLLHAEEIRREQAQGRMLAMDGGHVLQTGDREWETRERQANRFAAELLLPKAQVSALFASAFPAPLASQSTKADLVRLYRFESIVAQRFLVSAEAVHYRLASLELIPQSYRKYRPEAGA